MSENKNKEWTKEELDFFMQEGIQPNPKGVYGDGGDGYFHYTVSADSAPVEDPADNNDLLP